MYRGHSVNKDVVLSKYYENREKKERLSFDNTYKAEDNPEGAVAVVDGDDFQQQSGTKSEKNNHGIGGHIGMTDLKKIFSFERHARQESNSGPYLTW